MSARVTPTCCDGFVEDSGANLTHFEVSFGYWTYPPVKARVKIVYVPDEIIDSVDILSWHAWAERGKWGHRLEKDGLPLIWLI